MNGLSTRFCLWRILIGEAADGSGLLINDLSVMAISDHITTLSTLAGGNLMGLS
jgi:hypothetical protein